MKTIDIHAHLVPRSLWQAAEAGRVWHGFRHEPGEGLGTFLGTNGKRTGFSSPKVRLTPEERLQDMDAQGVDMQVISIHTPLFGYHLDPAEGRALHVCNDTNSISGVLQIGRRLLAALGHDLISEALAFVESAHAGAFDRADMHEHVLRAVARRDESETFLGVEELDCTSRHGGLPASYAA